MVACAVCHMKFDASERAARNYASGRREPRCVLHRKDKPRPETKVAEYRLWWLERFPPGELFLMGAAMEHRATRREIVPNPDHPWVGEIEQTRREWLALAASADPVRADAA